MTAQDSRRVLRNRLKSHAWAALADCIEPLTRPLTVQARDASHHLTLSIARAASSQRTPEAEGYSGGRFFSDEEVAIVSNLDHENWRVGKQIASLCCVPKKGMSRLFILITNLVSRKVLIKNPDGNGYRLHPEFRRPGSGPAPAPGQE